MNAGDLRQRLVFEQMVEGQNESGFPINEKVVYTKSWASLETLRGRTFYAAATTNMEHNRAFTIRYQRKLVDGTRPKGLTVVWNGIDHQIVSIENDDGLNKTMTVLVKAVS